MILKNYHSKCVTFTIMLSINACFVFGKKLNYSWLENNDRFDFVVGISVKGKPVSTGILVSPLIVLTAANPIEREDDRHIKIHVIDGKYDRSRVLDIDGTARNQVQRNSHYWATFGFDGLSAPHHDIVLITLKHKLTFDPDPGHRKPINISPTKSLEPFDLEMPLSYAGFGFIDKLHVRQNVELELIEYKVETIYEDCNEWVPVTWGNFICISNIENFVGISAGAPLTYKEHLIGLGSFSVKRGSESILLFTDYRRYWRQGKLYIFIYEKGK